MAEQIRAPKPQTASFEYELFEGDPDHLRTVVATPTQTRPWIDPTALKLKHRIGRGVFGDVWLATHHQSADDFDEYHEVAVKMLHPLKEESTKMFVEKFEELFMKFRELEGVCWLHGISVIDGKICIAMRFCERSVGDRIALLKGGKVPLSDILRYGSELAKGILQLHSIGLLVLNLKPPNFLLNDHDKLVLGDFGIPFLLLGLPLLDSDMALRLGTPNYMAPEQWEPEVRGPISSETDAWGFGCSILEMLTGMQPWCGKTVGEIYHLVVIKHEKPYIPSALPPAVEDVIYGCFEYDLRNRPLMEDILHAFECSLNAVCNDGEWIGLSRAVPERPVKGYTSWCFLKDRLQLGDTVRSRKPQNGRRPRKMDIPEATVVGQDSDNDRNGTVLVKIPGLHNPFKVQEFSLERVTSGVAVGDWVQLKEKNSRHSSVGILHSVRRDGSVEVGFLGLEILWKGNLSEIQMAKAYYVGQFVKLKADVFTPRFEFPRKTGGEWATGRISQILPNGCLVIGFPGRFVFGNESTMTLADPAEVVLVSFDTCPGVVKKYQHIEDYHWVVRPLAIALGLLSIVKLGLFAGRHVGARIHKKKKGSVRDDQNSQNGGNAAWIPQRFQILFSEKEDSV